MVREKKREAAFYIPLILQHNKSLYLLRAFPPVVLKSLRKEITWFIVWKKTDRVMKTELSVSFSPMIVCQAGESANLFSVMI